MVDTNPSKSAPLGGAHRTLTLLPQAPPAHALPRPEGRGRRHRLRRGRGANKTLVTQRMKRSGMRWRIAGGQAVLTFRALIKSARFDRAWKAIIGATDTPANDNINPCAVIAIAA